MKIINNTRFNIDRLKKIINDDLSKNNFHHEKIYQICDETKLCFDISNLKKPEDECDFIKTVIARWEYMIKDYQKEKVIVISEI